VSCQYADFDEDALEFLDEWDEEKTYVPLAVLMQVKWLDGRHENWLRRTAGSSLYERHGTWEQERNRVRRRP
jgi:hypothetical protein